MAFQGTQNLSRRSRESRLVGRAKPHVSESEVYWSQYLTLSCILTSFVMGACADTPESSGEPVRSDSAGVTVVRNDQPDRMLDWTMERVLDLGGADEGPTAFFRVFPTSIGVDSLENLYVLDAGNFRVSVFDRAGRFLRSFGGQGEGPGEFGFPSDMAVTPGGEVAVYDFARRALIRFDEEGSYTGMFSLPGPLQRQVVLLDDGTITAAVTRATHSTDSTDYRVLALGRDTVEIAQVRQITQPEPQQFSCMSFASPPYFRPRVIWAAAGDRIASSVDATYSIQVFEQNRLDAIWRRDVPVIRATLELAAWEVAEGDSLRFRGPVAGPRIDCAVSAEEAARKFGYADVVPLLKNLAVTPEGGVWVRRRTDEPGVLPIDVFDASGGYLGTLPTETPFPALFRSSSEIISVESDEFGRSHVVVYRIEKES